jgi:nucleoside-diphosphate-sugar epimerase
MKRFAVTGATSSIGVHLIEKLLENNCFVYAIIRPNSNKAYRLNNHENLKVIELEMDEYYNLDKYIAEKIDGVYHLSWYGGRGLLRNDNIIHFKNYIDSIYIMISSIKLGAKIFIGTGSQAEYGTCIGKVEEDYIPNPITEYGKYKLKAFKTLSNLAKENNIKFIWTRIFSVYGKYDYEGTLVMSALKKLSNNEDLQLTECKQNWDFINVEDVANAMYMLGTYDCDDGIYNIASGKIKQLKDFVLDMKRITNSCSNLEFGAIEYGFEGVVSLEPSINKLKSNLDWSCKINFEDGIMSLLHAIQQEGYISE